MDRDLLMQMAYFSTNRFPYGSDIDMVSKYVLEYFVCNGFAEGCCHLIYEYGDIESLATLLQRANELYGVLDDIVPILEHGYIKEEDGSPFSGVVHRAEFSGVRSTFWASVRRSNRRIDVAIQEKVVEAFEEILSDTVFRPRLGIGFRGSYSAISLEIKNNITPEQIESSKVFIANFKSSQSLYGNGLQIALKEWPATLFLGKDVYQYVSNLEPESYR